MTQFERPSGYIPRIIDEEVERYLRVFGAVEIAGTMWCGKTWTSLMHGNSVSYVDNNLALAQADPTLMLHGDYPHVIDEWQRVPEIWDRVRHEIDRTKGLRGAFILTGSSTPFGLSGSMGNKTPSHSGAGRIGRLRMHPMSLQESGDSTGQVSLSGLFEGRFESCKASVDTLGLVDVACRGGWPEAIDLNSEDAQLVARDYLRIVLSEGVSRIGLDSDIARRMVASIARNLGQSTTYKTLIRDMFGSEEDPDIIMNEDKVRLYLAGLRGMYILEEVPGWAPPARSKKRFTTKPKRYLTDPSLAAALLGMSRDALLADWQTFGLVFENMAIRDLMVYARSLNLIDEVPLRYYHDDSGLEVDAIVQLADGRWAALEVKVSEDKVPDALKNLDALRRKLTENPKSQVGQPVFMAVLTGNGEYARQVEDDVYVIPLRVFGR